MKKKRACMRTLGSKELILLLCWVCVCLRSDKRENKRAEQQQRSRLRKCVKKRIIKSAATGIGSKYLPHAYDCCLQVIKHYFFVYIHNSSSHLSFFILSVYRHLKPHLSCISSSFFSPSFLYYFLRLQTALFFIFISLFNGRRRGIQILYFF